jgi:uncharacterized protein
MGPPAVSTGQGGCVSVSQPESDRLLAALRDPGCYPGLGGPVEVLETHISWVFLVAGHAYKVKKPLNLGFLDFSTLERRRFFCEEEVRLNRRTAPGLYLGTVPIVDGPDGVRLGGEGRTIEYAVEMRRFDQDALADGMARRGELRAAHIDAIAGAIAAFHAAIPTAPHDSAYGSPSHVAAPALQNFEQLGPLVFDCAETARLVALHAWTGREIDRLRRVLTARRRDGFVRECHGDLHLGNIAFVSGRPTPFDCVEFDPNLRWVDVMNEVAFLVMDLLEHGLGAAAWRFLSAYLEATGDYAGVRVLRFYLVYRAMVRAKIACIRARQPEAGAEARGRARRECREYLALAGSLATAMRPAIVLMHGLSGSGKSAVAQTLLERVGAVRVRSDVERKRLHGLTATARTAAEPFGGIYTPQATRLTYDRLHQAACDVAESGYPIIVDATFLSRAERDRFRALARACDASFLIVACRAGETTLRERLALRERTVDNASEADVAVLERQAAVQEPLNTDELGFAEPIDSEWEEARQRRALESIAARLLGREP